MIEDSVIEKTVLSSLIAFKDAYDKPARHLKAVHFSNENYAKIFKKIIALKNQGLEADVPSLLLDLEEPLQQALLEIVASEPTSNYKIYIQNMLKNYLLVKQEELANKIMQKSLDKELFSINELLENIEENPKDFKTFYEWVHEEAFNEKQKTFKTGISFIDKLLGGGVALGQLILLSGEPEAGKTSMATQMLEFISFSEKTAFFCFEFTVEQYLRAKLNNDANFANTAGKNLYIVNDEYGIENVAANIRHLHKSYGVRFFLIDSQMRVETHKARSLEEEETTKFSVLAKLAHQLNLVILFIVQTSKTDTQNPSGTKKGAHEASIAIKIEHVKNKNQDGVFSATQRKVTLWKNKQNGKHNAFLVHFDPLKRQFNQIVEG